MQWDCATVRTWFLLLREQKSRTSVCVFVLTMLRELVRVCVGAWLSLTRYYLDRDTKEMQYEVTSTATKIPGQQC